MKTYFAHPISNYDTREELHIIAALQRAGYEVVNPSDKQHQDRVEEIQAQHANRNDGARMVMEYFVDICRACEACVFQSFPDGSLGAGVVKEIQSFLDAGKPVQQVIADGKSFRLIDVTDLTPYEKLSVGETRMMLKSLKPSYKL